MLPENAVERRVPEDNSPALDRAYESAAINSSLYSDVAMVG